MLVEVNVFEPDADILWQYILRLVPMNRKISKPPKTKEPMGIHMLEAF